MQFATDCETSYRSECRMLYCDLKPNCFVLQDRKVNQAPEKNSSGWRTNAGERLNLVMRTHLYAIHTRVDVMHVITWCKRNALCERTTCRNHYFETKREMKTIEIRF